MASRRILIAVAVLAMILPLSASAQVAVSTKSGLINAADGDVYLNGKPVKIEFGNFTSIPNWGTLRTDEGRAEVLLTPGVFLRTGAGSSLKMLSNKLSDTQIELTRGIHSIEVVNLEDDNQVTVHMAKLTIPMEHAGIYEFDVDDGIVRVFDGKLRVMAGDTTLTLKRGRFLNVNDGMEVAKFDPDDVDGLLRWSMNRSRYIAMANLSAARSAGQSAMWNGLRNYSPAGFTTIDGYFPGAPRWFYNPYYGMYTYIPYTGYYSSPFGWSFYSPATAVTVYNRNPRGVIGRSGGDFGANRGGGYIGPSSRSSASSYSPAPRVSGVSPGPSGSSGARSMSSPRSSPTAGPRNTGGTGGRR